MLHGYRYFEIAQSSIILRSSFDTDHEGERVNLGAVVSLKSAMDGNERKLEQLPACEIDLYWDAQFADVEFHEQAFIGRAAGDTDVTEDEKIRFFNLVVRVIGGDFVGCADGFHEDFRECAGEGHGSCEDVGLEGFASFRNDFVDICTMEADRLMDGDYRDGCCVQACAACEGDDEGFHEWIMNIEGENSSSEGGMYVDWETKKADGR